MIEGAKVRVLRTREEIESLRDFWQSCRPGRDADLDFYLFIADLYPETLRPHVVAFYDRDGPKALLAGRLDICRLPIKIGYTALPLPTVKVLRFVHGGYLGEVSETTTKSLIESVSSSLSNNEADVAMLEHIDLGSPLARFARRSSSWLCSDHLVQPETHRLRDLSGIDGLFLASLSKKERYHQRSRREKIFNDYPSSNIRLFSEQDEVEHLIRDAESVARKSYQRGIGVGFAESPILRARLDFEAKQGWLRGYVLYLDGKPSAFWIGTLRDQVFFSNYLAFDPTDAAYGPGLYLIIEVIEKMCVHSAGGAKLATQIDFGIGDASYKDRLSNSSREESVIYIFAPRVKAVCMNMLRSLAGAMNGSAKRLLRLTPFFESVKRKLRTSATPGKG